MGSRIEVTSPTPIRQGDENCQDPINKKDKGQLVESASNAAAVPLCEAAKLCKLFLYGVCNQMKTLLR